MKVSELIEKLKEQQELVGDKEVLVDPTFDDECCAFSISNVVYFSTYGQIYINV